MHAKLILAAAAVLAFGVLRLPIETGIQSQLRAAGAHQGSIDPDLRDELGQTGLLAVFGGFRSLVASIITIESITARDNNEWGEVENRYALACRLQPNVISYWNSAHAQMGYDAVHYYIYHRDTADLPRETKRSLVLRYLERAKQFLEEGLQANPGARELAASYGLLLANKEQRPFIYDPCEASRYFDIAAAAPGAPAYYARMAAYRLDECPGRERDAHARLAALFRENERNHKPTLLRKLHRLESTLSIPPEERLVPEPPPEPEPLGEQKILR